MSPMFVPGPVDVDPEVLAAQAQPMLPHRSEAFETIFRRAAEKAQQVFFTENRVLITASSGTGLQEAAVRNLVRERVLACVNGAFAARWHDVAQTNGKAVTRLEAPWGQPIDPDKVADALRQETYEPCWWCTTKRLPGWKTRSRPLRLQRRRPALRRSSAWMQSPPSAARGSRWMPGGWISS